MSDSLDFDPFDRMLLTADGTVTSLLEACTGEPIATRTTRQASPATLDRLLTITGGWWQPEAGLVELAPVESALRSNGHGVPWPPAPDTAPAYPRARTVAAAGPVDPKETQVDTRARRQ